MFWNSRLLCSLNAPRQLANMRVVDRVATRVSAWEPQRRAAETLPCLFHVLDGCGLSRQELKLRFKTILTHWEADVCLLPSGWTWLWSRWRLHQFSAMLIKRSDKQLLEVRGAIRTSHSGYNNQSLFNPAPRSNRESNLLPKYLIVAALKPSHFFLTGWQFTRVLCAFSPRCPWSLWFTTSNCTLKATRSHQAPPTQPLRLPRLWRCFFSAWFSNRLPAFSPAN